MKVLTASILALGLAASIGTASAQSSGYYSQYGQPQQYGQSQYGQTQYGQAQYGQYGQPAYGQPTADRYGQSSGAYYDYARVLRVDPVYAQGYGNSGYAYPASAQQGCITRQDSYAGNGYNNGYNNGYGNSAYGNSGYVNDGYNNGYNNGYANQGSTAGRTVATVIGGVLGAALGSQVGGGSARYATSAIGSMVGGVVGQRVYENAQRNRYPRTGVVQVCDPVQVDNGGYQGSYTQAGYGQSGQYGNARISAYDVTYEYGGRTYTTRTSYNPGSRMRVRVAVNPS